MHWIYQEYWHKFLRWFQDICTTDEYQTRSSLKVFRQNSYYLSILSMVSLFFSLRLENSVEKKMLSLYRHWQNTTRFFNRLGKYYCCEGNQLKTSKNGNKFFSTIVGISSKAEDVLISNFERFLSIFSTLNENSYGTARKEGRENLLVTYSTK